MPLIDLKTNLKSLKYGSDRVGNGNSGQPYIQFPIDGPGISSQFSDYYKSNRNSLDFPIRGGGLDFELGSQTVTKSGKIDKQRIEKFLRDAPRGTTFITKQIGLQLSNPKTETGTSLMAFGSYNPLPGISENIRIYNGGRNTLDQVGLAGTGVHLNRHGLVPLDLSSKYYKDIVGAQLRMSQDEVQSQNRLLILQQLKLRSDTPISLVVNTLGSLNKINQLGISMNRNVLQNYWGGPGSSYGIGNTVIRRYEDTTQAVKKVRSGASLSYDQIMDMKVRGSKERMERLTSVNLPVADQDTIDYKFYTYFSGSIVDNINFADIKPVAGDPWPEAEHDMIKMGFECIDNDDPSLSIFLQFRAFLTSGLSDSHQASLNTFKYMGRGEDFYVYQGFSRTVGFSFRVAAFSKREMLNIYEKLNALVSQVYPDYSSNGVMRSSIVKLTIGDYLYRVPGFLESINVTVDQQANWEIDEGMQLPHFFDVDISFRPIHDVLPKKNTYASKTNLVANGSLSNLSLKQLNDLRVVTRGVRNTVEPEDFAPPLVSNPINSITSAFP